MWNMCHVSFGSWKQQKLPLLGHQTIFSHNPGSDIINAAYRCSVIAYRLIEGLRHEFPTEDRLTPTSRKADFNMGDKLGMRKLSNS